MITQIPALQTNVTPTNQISTLPVLLIVSIERHKR